MRAFQIHKGVVMPLDRANVDTDAIIPKQFLKSVKRSGFGPNLFDEWRYLDHGEPGMDCSQRPLNMEFVLNDPGYKGASILLARDNFGCGSSREHAPWALEDFGFRAIIAPSFADIFFNNCFKNGLLPIVLPGEVVEQLFQTIFRKKSYTLEINLADKTVYSDDGEQWEFEIDEFRQYRLLNGLDDIALTLENSSDIRAYEVTHKEQAPWLFNPLT